MKEGSLAMPYNNLCSLHLYGECMFSIFIIIVIFV